MVFELEVTDLVGHHIINQRQGGHDNPPVESQFALSGATPPALRLIADKDGGRNVAEPAGKHSDALR
jgi:hypothetical protein